VDEELNDYDEYMAVPRSLECILNVAGSRKSHASGIQQPVFKLMVELLLKVNTTSKHFARLRTGTST